MLRFLCIVAFFTALALSPAAAQDPPPLSAPTDLSASVSIEGVTLSWTAPAGTIDGYEILRQRPLQDETALSTLADDTGSSDTSYIDTSATTLGEQYIYGVKSISGTDRSEVSDTITVDYPTTLPVDVSISCEIVAGANHDILQCTVSAEDVVITSALWTPSFEEQYAQTTTRLSAAWVIADEYCGESTTVEVEAQSGDSPLPTAETTITLECASPPTDTLIVSCENVVESSQLKLRCTASAGDDEITEAYWVPSIGAHHAQTTEGPEATWDISDTICGQAITIQVSSVMAGTTSLPDGETTMSLPCLITVDDNCSLANAIRSANGDDQVEESGDTDGNDDCEDGVDPDDTTTPPHTGDDAILLTRNITLEAALPSITSRIQIFGNNRSISGDDQHRVFTVEGGQFEVSDLTITKGLASTVGGGIYVNGGAMSISDSTISDSSASDIGGGIYAIDSDVEIADTTFSENSTVKSHGGGVYFVSSTGLHTLDMSGATFRENSATEDGGGMKTAGGIVNIRNSTFVENESDEGGAIESSETTIDIANSTFSNNSAREGGGLSSFSSFVTLTHTTWAYNSADEQGGGIAIIGWTGNVRMRNTLITESTSGGDCHSGPNPDIIIEFTGNFIQDGSCTPEPAESQAAPAEGADIEAEAQHIERGHEHEGADAKISALSGNPPLHALQWGSPAIDNADPLYCLLGDQAYTPRPQYGNCDIGAYEYPKRPPISDAPDPPDPPEQPDPPEPRDETPEPPAPPQPTATLSPDCIHIVSDGENLFRIAILYNMTVREISSFNNLLRDDQLSVGQELVIPFEHCGSPNPLKG